MNALLEESENPRTLIDDLLAEQQVLTAVERFARKHERNVLPAQARYYRDLIPLSKPGAGEQYAFGVDLDACTGCKACVSACHSLNGLDEDEIWRDTGLLHGGSTAEPYQQTVTTACHHCVEPACLLGCPVKAYEKDAETGIVRHLDDQCIGCQYCVLKCPYDVPKYSQKRGIVRKCDMCHGRLSAGEAPACVQACPSGAITIRIVEKSAHVASLATGNRLLPGAFDSEYTKPTTAYTSSRPMPANARPGNADALRLEHAHWPLIAMLVLTQIAAGIFLSAAALALGDADGFKSAQVPFAVVAFTILNLGLAVSVLHLGRPLGAWRAFLGLRTSWMSREILAFTIFAASAGAFTGAAMWKTLVAMLPALGLVERFVAPAHWVVPLAIVTAGLGLIGVFCSAMIYVDTRRAYWRSEQTFIKFFGTTVLLGSGGAAAVLRWTDALTSAPPIAAATILTFVATLIQAALFYWELQNLHRSLCDESDADHRSALVIWKLRRSLLMARCGIFAGAMFCGILANTDTGWNGAVSATFAFLLTLGSQLIERYFFFTAVVAPRMPGPLSSSSAIHA
jgi:Fe-S-cluster-containing dehydrogenase component/DMSO reductase anchor subunit